MDDDNHCSILSCTVISSIHSNKSSSRNFVRLGAKLVVIALLLLAVAFHHRHHPTTSTAYCYDSYSLSSPFKSGGRIQRRSLNDYYYRQREPPLHQLQPIVDNPSSFLSTSTTSDRLISTATATTTSTSTLTMVEGHSVHRVATLHRQRLVGRTFHATSPNGRFTDGALLIDRKPFTRIEPVGKNLFCFFGGHSNKNNNGLKKKSKKSNSQSHSSPNPSDDVVVVHVHFGMAGNWAVYDLHMGETPPDPPSNTCRLRLTDTQGQYVADLSAMTVQHGTVEDLYNAKRSKLGQDPLREDADPELLWTKVSSSKKSIGALIMDQSYFTGPGNIYRAEICFKASIHPDRLGNTLSRPEFDRIWYHTVDLLRRGYESGSILTVDPDEAKQLGRPNMRRYIYNTSKCPRCSASIQTWQINSRTCYACPQCQPRHGVDEEDNGESNYMTPASTISEVLSSTTSSSSSRVVTPIKKSSKETNRKQKTPSTKKKTTTTATTDCVPFSSHCARESVTSRLQESGPSRLTVKEIRSQLQMLGVDMMTVPRSLKKAQLVDRLQIVMADQEGSSKKHRPTNSSAASMIVSSEDAAMEKAAAGESLAVEHIAELAPKQARRARSKVMATTVRETKKTNKSKTNKKRRLEEIPSSSQPSKSKKSTSNKRSKRSR